MSVKSAFAAGDKMTGCLRLDIGAGPFTPPETLLGISSHLSNQRRSERDSFSLIEPVKAGLQQGAKLGKLMLSLVEQSHRFADHGIHVGELTVGNLFPYQVSTSAGSRNVIASPSQALPLPPPSPFNEQ